MPYPSLALTSNVSKLILLLLPSYHVMVELLLSRLLQLLLHRLLLLMRLKLLLLLLLVLSVKLGLRIIELSGTASTHHLGILLVLHILTSHSLGCSHAETSSCSCCKYLLLMEWLAVLLIQTANTRSVHIWDITLRRDEVLLCLQTTTTHSLAALWIFIRTVPH